MDSPRAIKLRKVVVAHVEAGKTGHSKALVNATRTASARYSGVGFDGMMALL